MNTNRRWNLSTFVSTGQPSNVYIHHLLTMIEFSLLPIFSQLSEADEIQSFLCNKTSLYLIIISQMKIIVLTLFTILLSRTVMTQTTNNTATTNLDEFVNLQVDNLDDVHSYLQSEIFNFYDYLDVWNLVEVKERKNPDTDKVQIIYIFNLLQANLTSNTNKVINESVIFILGTDNLTYFGLFNGTNAYFANYTSYQIESKTSRLAGGVITVGGFQSVDISNLDDGSKKAKQFALQKVPKLQNWTLVSLSQQIVSGVNYCFTFQDPSSANSQKYCVWSQPWTQTLQLTLLDGTVIKNTDQAPTTDPSLTTAASSTPAVNTAPSSTTVPTTTDSSMPATATAAPITTSTALASSATNSDTNPPAPTTAALSTSSSTSTTVNLSKSLTINNPSV